MNVIDRFRKHGRFVMSAGKPDLKIDETLPAGWGVSAFRQDGDWKYARSAQRTARRLRSYLRHQATASQSRPVHIALRAALVVAPVEVFALAFADPIAELDGLPVHAPLGIEAGLIDRLRPLWNHRGLRRPADPTCLA